MGAHFHTVLPRDGADAPLPPLCAAVLGVCRTDRPLTATDIAAALGVPCDDRLRGACTRLAREGRLYRKRYAHGYWLTRCRGV